MVQNCLRILLCGYRYNEKKMYCKCTILSNYPNYPVCLCLLVMLHCKFALMILGLSFQQPLGQTAYSPEIYFTILVLIQPLKTL